jgi:hypothetical protein
MVMTMSAGSTGGALPVKELEGAAIPTRGDRMLSLCAQGLLRGNETPGASQHTG